MIDSKSYDYIIGFASGIYGVLHVKTFCVNVLEITFPTSQAYQHGLVDGNNIAISNPRWLARHKPGQHLPVINGSGGCSVVPSGHYAVKVGDNYYYDPQGYLAAIVRMVDKGYCFKRTGRSSAPEDIWWSDSDQNIFKYPPDEHYPFYDILHS